MGRHRRIPDIDEAKKLRLLACAGLTQIEAANRLGIGRRALYKRLRSNPILMQAWEDGRRQWQSRKTSDKRSGGRSRVAIDVGLIQQLAADGASQTAIAAALGTSTPTLRKRLAEEPQVAEAIARGRADLVDQVTTASARQAKLGDPATARLLLDRLLGEKGAEDPFQRLLRAKGYV